MDYQLWLGDCLEEMDRIESGSVDAIICDLPFGVTSCKWDTVIPFEPLWKQYKRVIKKNGAVVLFGSEPFTSLLVVSNLEWFKYEWIWEKSMPMGAGNANYQPMIYHENILIFYENRPTFNKQMTERSQGGRDRAKYIINGNYGSHHFKAKQVAKRYDPEVVNPKTVLKYASVPNAKGYKLHPTQKPVALLSYLIKTYTNEGDIVLDNTMGSGSTGEACLRTGRRFIGIEKDLNYFNVAQQRLERVAAELRGELNHLPMFTEAAV